MVYLDKIIGINQCDWVPFNLKQAQDILVKEACAPSSVICLSIVKEARIDINTLYKKKWKE